MCDLWNGVLEKGLRNIGAGGKKAQETEGGRPRNPLTVDWCKGFESWALDLHEIRILLLNTVGQKA